MSVPAGMIEVEGDKPKVERSRGRIAKEARAAEAQAAREQKADPPPRRHKCWPQTRALLNGHYIERCACGAFGPAPFFMLGRDEPRVAGDPEPRHLFMRGLEILRGR